MHLEWHGMTMTDLLFDGLENNFFLLAQVYLMHDKFLSPDLNGIHLY